MATVNVNGTKMAFMVIDKSTGKPVELPLHAQEAIMQPINNLKKWILGRMRTGGTGEMVQGGQIFYYAFPKGEKARDIKIEYDDTTGKISGGMFGAADSDNLLGGIKSSYGTPIVKDFVEIKPAKFLKKRVMKQDVKEKGLTVIITLTLSEFTLEILESALVSLKAAFVGFIGTIGKWAKDAGHTLPTTGPGVRVEAKDYPMTAAGGIEAINDIRKKLQYRDRIGLKDGVEAGYPFARGLDTSKSCVIDISSEVNDAIMLALQDSKNGFVVGATYDRDKAIVKTIAYNGKTVKINVIDDMPAKGGKKFNWLISEIGKHGAIAMPNKFDNKSLVRPDSEGLELEGVIIEAVGLLMGMKPLQPELMFGSFGA